MYGYNTDILGCVVEKASGMRLLLNASVWQPFIRAARTGLSSARQKDRRGKVLMWTARGRALREVRVSPPRPTTKRDFSRWSAAAARWEEFGSWRLAPSNS